MSTTLKEPIAHRVKLEDLTVLSENWYVLRKATFKYQRRDGSWQTQFRESYDRGDGAVLLPYDPGRGTVVLVRQFRWPAFEKGFDQLMIEAPAGLLDKHDPLGTVIAEAEEEAGLLLDPARAEYLFSLHMSPGAVTEKLSFYVAAYNADDRQSDGGGLLEEGEDIEVLELPFADALGLVDQGVLTDAKTVILLQWLQLSGRMG